MHRSLPPPNRTPATAAGISVRLLSLRPAVARLLTNMARTKTTNPPDLRALLLPQTPIMAAVERAVRRSQEWSVAAAPVAERIAVLLAGVITIDLIHAGQRLLEKDLSDVLRVSRAPVREALRILERERLVEFQPRRGAIVTAPNAQDLRDIYAVRSALLEILFRQLMETRPADLEAVFARHIPRIAKAGKSGSVDAYALESFLLNMEVLELSANQLIADLLASIALRTLRYVRLGLAADRSRITTSVETWRALQEAIATRHVEQVMMTVARRINDSREAAVRALDVSPSAKGTPSPARRTRAVEPPPTAGSAQPVRSPRRSGGLVRAGRRTAA